MKIIVVGGGKVGYYLSKTLLEHGHTPVVIETSKELCHYIANNLDIAVVSGDGTTIEALEAANAGDCDVLVSVTGQDENNLISCQLAKKLFNVAKTIAKVNNPKNLECMRQLGVDITISSTDNIARLLEHEVDATAFKRIADINHGQAAIVEVTLPENYKLHGKKLQEIKLPTNAVVVSVNRNGTTIIPRGDTQLLSGDSVILMAKNDAIHDIKNYLRLGSS